MMQGMTLQKLSLGASMAGRWTTIAIGASIPVSIAIDNVLLALTLLSWAIGMHFREKLLLVWRNPVYRAALLLFAVLLIGTAYGEQAPGDASTYLFKYRELVLIPVLGWALALPEGRAYALRTLACGLALVLLISCGLKAGLVPPMSWLKGVADSPYLVFKPRLTHNILMAFAAFLFAWLSCSAASRRARIGWGFLSVLAVANILLMVEGATGYIQLIVMALLFGWQRARLRGIGMALAAITVAIAVLISIPGPFQNRIHEILFDVKREQADRPASTSAGYRMEFYRNTLALISKNPVFGAGTGSFPAEYAELVDGSGQKLSRNPHNEFMLITMQTGIVGLVAMLWLLWLQWRLARLLPTPLERGLGEGLVIMMIVICMLNSALLDHTEGLLYAWLTAVLYAGLPRGHASGAQYGQLPHN